MFILGSFRALCTGEKGISRLSQQALHFKGSIIHRVIRELRIGALLFTKLTDLHCQRDSWLKEEVRTNDINVFIPS